MQINLICAVLTSLTYLSSLQIASAYFDPGTQRWLNRDPIHEKGGFNLYCYCLDSPITFVDRNGQGAGTIVWPVLETVGEWTIVISSGGIIAVGGTTIGGGIIVGPILFPPPSPIVYPPTYPGRVNAPPISITVCPTQTWTDPKKDKAQQECLDQVSQYDEAVRRGGYPPLTREEKQKVYNDCMASKGFPVGK